MFRLEHNCSHLISIHRLGLSIFLLVINLLLLLPILSWESLLPLMSKASQKILPSRVVNPCSPSPITGPTGRINRAVWGSLNKTIISAVVRIWDSETGKLLKESDPEVGHKKPITSLTKSADGSHFLTGSLDKSAKLWDTRTLTLIKTYATERPVNAVTMSPLLDHVVLGGGQDASSVTTTDHRAGKFEAKFYDKVLQEEIGGVKGHFGPINALAFNPDGKSFSSGGEDGYVRLHHFDPDYFNIKI
uniref:Serine-threonine kinase receptor-associated protein n=1 Tax=Populus trichocarpa TaxID=3694 RepID=A0A2K1YRP9_POPTR